MADIESNGEWTAPLAPKFVDFSVQPPPVMYNLKPNALVDFHPTQVIYRRLIPAPPIGCCYAFIDTPTPIGGDPEEIRSFVYEAARGNYTRTNPMNEEDYPLGILVKKDSYIVLHLDDTYPTWDFTDAYEAVTLSELVDPDPSRLYGNLKYVRPSGSIFEDAVPGCRLVYFEARYREGTVLQRYIQKFNLGVDSGNPQTTHWIDPDIRHPGNGIE